MNDKGPLSERICVWLCVAFGCNPANFVLLREEDFIVRTFNDSEYSFYELKIPRIKKRGLKHQRAEFKTRKYESSDPTSRIKYQEKADPKKIHGIGVCGANFLCKLYPPLSCYLCENFQPFKDAPHAKILDDLTDWRQKRLEQQGENDRIAQQLDDVIYRVAQVKAACMKPEVLNEKQ